ncbi:MAG: beta-lactamase family protein [Porticoccaceae bacterium]|nr:beta-lactamase family protein [Porticoccaceae bacterium]
MKKINLWSRLIVSILALCLCSVAAADSAVVVNPIEATKAEYPGEQWTVVHPESLNLEQSKIDRLFDLSFQDSATEAVVLIKNGFLVGERYADGYDQSSYGTSWSMAKSFYASLIGISIDRGEIASLDDKVSQYLDYFNDERADITLRQLLNMTSGLEMPSHEHENMFFTADHLAYAKTVGVEKEAGQTFEYNNVNSMLLSDILQRVTGVPADELLRDRVLNKIGLTNVTLWRDSAGNPLTYCCIDTTARDYSRFGLLFSRGGKWNDEQVISERYVNETFTKVWGNLSGSTIEQERGYSLHWWISRHDEKAIIFNASGKFGQYIFVDRANDVIFTRITKYHSTGGSVQDWGPLAYINWIGSVNFRSKLAAILDSLGLMTIQGNVQTPLTFEDGTSKEFNTNYNEIMDALVDISAKD